MKVLARGFLAGFGFALGASVAGTLIGYTIGRIGEASVKRLLSPAPTSSPAPFSLPASSEPSDTDEVPPPGDSDCTCCPAAADGHNGWCTVRYNQGYEDGLAMGSGVDMRPADPVEIDLDELHETGSTRIKGFRHHLYDDDHKSHYDAPDVEGRVHLLLPYKYQMACGRKVGDHWGSALNFEAVNCPDCIASHYGAAGQSFYERMQADGRRAGWVPPDEPHNADYVLEPIGERCGARNGDLVCILSKGHTKPVDHWNGTFGFDAAPFHTCEIGVPDADHPLRTDSAHCGGCAPQCDLFPGQTCTAVPQKCRTFCERR